MSGIVPSVEDGKSASARQHQTFHLISLSLQHVITQFVLSWVLVLASLARSQDGEVARPGPTSAGTFTRLLRRGTTVLRQHHPA